MRGRITRRSVLGQMACAAAWAQAPGIPSTVLPQSAPPLAPLATPNDNDPLRLLRPGHPRLVLLDSELDKIRVATKENALAKRIFGDLEKECDRLLSVPPVRYELTGNRLQTQTRRAVDRITTLALMYRLSGRDPWLRRAIMELKACAEFRDWNPARFVDTAEMTHAFAIGYDWLFNALSPEERGWVRDALIAKGLDQAWPIYQQKARWTQEHFNANIVCNSAMIMGALAVADETHDKASEIVRAALESIPHGLNTYGADGGWPEGPTYGAYATRYACLFFASLDTALGNDYGLSGFHGVDRAGRFRVYSISPSNRIFSFGDGPDDPGLAPEMFWMAKRFNNPVYAWSEQKQLERSVHPDAYDLAWFVREARAPQAPAWPLDAVFHGVGAAMFRSSWEDTNGLFLAVKAGSNNVPHAHFDLGSFMFDAGGVRWALDYDDGDVNVQTVQKPPLYTIRTESHNTLLIDGENQDARAEARITRQELGQDFSWVQLDLSKANPRVKQWTRRIGMAQRQAVLIEDALHSDQPVEAIWGMMTDADISPNGPTATLHKNGWNLSVEIRTPRHAVFDVMPVRAGFGQPQNAKFQKLIVRLLEKVTDLDLNIVLTPYRDGQAKFKTTTQFPV
jgi:hypothetical protein